MALRCGALLSEPLTPADTPSRPGSCAPVPAASQPGLYYSLTS